MNIKVINLINGEMMIGQVEGDTLPTDAEVQLYNPMFIIQTAADVMSIGFKLEDTLIFGSKEPYIFIKPQHIVFSYDPGQALEDYYYVSLEYHKKTMRSVIEEQVVSSTEYLTDYNKGKKSPSRFTRSKLN